MYASHKPASQGPHYNRMQTNIHTNISKCNNFGQNLNNIDNEKISSKNRAN